MFVFGDLNIHHKEWLNYSGGTDRSRELCYNFSISNDLTQVVNFPIRSQTVILIVPLDFFLSSDASICSAMAFPPLGNYDHFVVSVSIDFPSNSEWNAQLYRIAYDYYHADWDGPRDHLRELHVRVSLGSVLLCC